MNRLTYFDDEGTRVAVTRRDVLVDVLVVAGAIALDVLLIAGAIALLIAFVWLVDVWAMGMWWRYLLVASISLWVLVHYARKTIREEAGRD